jgi:nucleoside-diphosphate-sugar epimerase
VSAPLRESTAALADRRRAREGTILLTGGTGFLGSHLAVAFAERGWPVVLLARPAGGISARERVGAALGWFGRSFADFPGLSVVEGQLDQPGFGLDPATARRLTQDVVDVVHCASDTDFTERRRAALVASNVGAFGRLLDFAGAGRTAFLHVVSTAYVAGRVEGPCPEIPAHGTAFHNPYEETKAAAERLATAACATHGIRLALWRPSIVYGDARTGRSRKFNALYFPVRTVDRLQRLLGADIDKVGGARAAALGARRLDDGRLLLPIRMRTRPGGRINLVPVDFFTAAALACFEQDLTGGIHHMVSPRPVPLADLTAFTARLYGIEGLTATEDAIPDAERTPLEALFESYIRLYLPYIGDRREFGDATTRPLLAAAGVSCPPFSWPIFERCMRYAMEVDWGKRLDGAG